MKQHLLRFILFALCGSGWFSGHSQYVTIPDTNFVTWLYTHGYAGCMNGNQMDTTCSILDNPPSYDLSYAQITDPTGLEFIGFGLGPVVNLSHNNINRRPKFKWSSYIKHLDCSYNQIDTFYVGDWFDLRTLNISHNKLKSVTFYSPQNWQIQNLNLSYNEFQTLPSLNSTASIEINISHNQLTNLPLVSWQCYDLDCSYNQLTSIGGTAIPYKCATFNCSHNNISSINSTLQGSFYGYLQFSFDCSYNQLSALNQFPNHCPDVNLSFNPALECLPLIPEVLQILNIDSTSVSCLPNHPSTLTTVLPMPPPVCSYSNSTVCPVFSNISGTVFGNQNNCIIDTADKPLKNIWVYLYKNGQLLQSMKTTATGNYSFYTDTGMHTVVVDTSALKPSCTDSIYSNVNVLTTTNNISGINLALSCPEGFDVGVSAITAGVQGATLLANAANTVKIRAGNVPNFYGANCDSAFSGQLIFTLDGPVTYLNTVNGTPGPDSINGNTIIWNINDWSVFNADSTFYVLVSVDSIIPGSAVGCFTALATHAGGDNNPANDSLTRCFTIGFPLDPNSKDVYPAGIIDSSQQWLTYTIHFQNVGTAPAHNIYILDTLNTNLNWPSLEVLDYSHENIVQILPGGIVKFNFPAINLPDSTHDEANSHGYVTFRIGLKDNLAAGTEIRNAAGIYFDLNAPVQTNTVQNAIACFNESRTELATICKGKQYGFYGLALDSTGIYYAHLPTSLGCDTLVTLQLNVSAAPIYSQSATFCFEESAHFFGLAVDTTGYYEVVLKDSAGCDVVQALNAEVLPEKHTTIFEITCEGTPFPFHGNQLDSSGIYTAHLNGFNGCDSLITLNLTVNNKLQYNFSQTICFGEHYNFYGLQLDSAGIYSVSVSNPSSCDSVIDLELVVLPEKSSSIQAAICSGEVYDFNGTTLDTSGTYTFITNSGDGCDSAISLNLSVLPKASSFITTAICTGDSVLIEGIILKQAGVYDFHYINAVGCDSLVTISVSENQLPDLTLIASNDTICKGETVTIYSNSTAEVYWQDFGLTQESLVANPDTSTTYVAVASSIAGCSSEESVTITVVNCLGISTLSAQGFGIYPNPTSGIVAVKADALFYLELYDLHGRKLVETRTTAQQHLLDLSALAKGLYEIAITFVDGSKGLGKVVVE